MVLFTTFEFIRKPWEGKELEIEKIMQLQADKLFDSISSMHTDGDYFNPEGTTDPGVN